MPMLSYHPISHVKIDTHGPVIFRPFFNNSTACKAKDNVNLGATDILLAAQNARD